MKTELKVGIFFIVVIIILSYMTFKVSGLGIAWKKGYRLHVVFDNISGLDEKSKVKVAGVNAGIVEKVRLKSGKAKISLLMDPSVEVHDDAKASLRVSGLLGDKYLSIWAGTPERPLLKSGAVIKNTESAADIDALANQLSSAAAYISDLAENFKEIFGETEKDDIKKTIHNLRAITESFNVLLKEDRKPLHNLLVNLENFSDVLGNKGPGLINDLSILASDLRSVVEENRQAFNESVENINKFSQTADDIARKVDKGEGTLGKLFQDDKLYDSFNKVAEGAAKSFDTIDKLKTYLEFRAEYLTDEGDSKGYFDLTVKPNEDMYYILGVVSDPIASSEITETITDGVKEREEKIKRKIEFTAQLARRFEDFVVRAGMIESTFGFGADYFFHNDKGKLSLSAWDFSADEAFAERAHLKIGLDYRVFKQLFISSGFDNLLNKNRRGIFVGGGLKFEDKDLKYILGLLP